MLKRIEVARAPTHDHSLGDLMPPWESFLRTRDPSSLSTANSERWLAVGQEVLEDNDGETQRC